MEMKRLKLLFSLSLLVMGRGGGIEEVYISKVHYGGGGTGSTSINMLIINGGTGRFIAYTGRLSKGKKRMVWLGLKLRDLTKILARNLEILNDLTTRDASINRDGTY
jgi:hypothetical protein